MISTPRVSPCARAGWMTPPVSTFPITEAHPTNTNKQVPNSSARQGCTYSSYLHRILLLLLMSFSTFGSPITVKTSVLLSSPDMLYLKPSALCLTPSTSTGGLQYDQHIVLYISHTYDDAKGKCVRPCVFAVMPLLPSIFYTAKIFKMSLLND